MKRARSIQQRLARYTECGPGGCFLWTGATNPKGYGVCSDGLVHRAAYAALVGPIPEGMNVLHRCDVPRCCNPAHLYLGDQKQNMRDMLARGRLGARGQRPGAAHAMAKLSEEQARSLLTDAAGGRKAKELASQYGVSVTQVRRIVSGERWSHLQA